MVVVPDDSNLVANAGLVAVATLAVRLGLERLIDETVRLAGRVGAANPGSKVLTLVHTLVAGGSHIDHADMLRAGATRRILPFRVAAPSTLGTFLRSFTFGHVRQLDRVLAETLTRVWALGAGPGPGRLIIDVDSTICEVFGDRKQGAVYAYSGKKGYHPLVATRADTGEMLHVRLREGSSHRGANRFLEELVARVRRAGASGEILIRADSGFWSRRLIDTCDRLGIGYSITAKTTPPSKRWSHRSRNPRGFGSASPAPTTPRWPRPPTPSKGGESTASQPRRCG
ncbi:MAG: IS1380 family transposase [Acidimicrobiia bacterium]